MSDVATHIALLDDATMGRRPKSEYVPPSDTKAVMLSDALRGTGRFQDRTQLNFFGPPRDRSDIRIYYAGDLSLLEAPSVAVVGTREVSESGRARTRRLTRQLVEAGINVVSGLAYGVDTVAHTTAIEMGGRTVAVIGTPLDKASPAENAKLQEVVYRQHLLISQFRTGETTFRANFPLRNKLMAILSDATVVMEAREGSGTLHQAAECTRLGRWLFIAKSVVEDKSLQWPSKFLKYETCVPLETIDDITSRVLSPTN
jgi:DNA processing protein